MLTGRKNQCQGCKEFFTANSSFSKHRTGEYGGGRRCMTEAEMLEKKIARYESDPATGEGKKELLAKARGLEAERSVAKQRSPWYTYAGSLLQIAIVFLTASILLIIYCVNKCVGGIVNGS
jgi:hypothetical protein